jgi:signal transduction histidine kinase
MAWDTSWAPAADLASDPASDPARDPTRANVAGDARGRLAALRGRYRPSVRTVLMVVTLTVLLLPLGSVVFFRIYENQLVRETEAELIAQAAVLAAVFDRTVAASAVEPGDYGAPVVPRNVPSRYASSPADQETPTEPLIDLATHATRPRRPHAVPAAEPASPAMLRIGADIAGLFVEAQKTTLAGLRVLDHRGVVIGGRDEIGLSLAHVEEVAEAMQGRYASALRQRALDSPAPPLASLSRGTGVRIFSAFPVVRGDRLLGIVYLSRTPNNILRHMFATRDRFFLAGLTILGLTLLLGWVTTRTLVRPINRLAAQAAELGRGNRRALAPLDHYGTAELAALGRSFLEMARALDGRSQYIRDFAAHVSHELKGPLSAIRGSAELLQEHLATMSEADRSRFLGNIVADTDRLRLLVSRLIELAHAENVPRAETSIDIAAAVDRLARRHSGTGLAITRTGLERLETCISAESFEIIAANLIQNSREAGASAVEVHLEATGRAARIIFRDDGRGVTEGNRARIFEPFFTTRREHGGTGLGLQIARSLIEAQHGTIELVPGSRGAIFALTLPSSLLRR